MGSGNITIKKKNGKENKINGLILKKKLIKLIKWGKILIIKMINEYIFNGKRNNRKQTNNYLYLYFVFWY